MLAVISSSLNIHGLLFYDQYLLEYATKLWMSDLAAEPQYSIWSKSSILFKALQLK